MAKFFPNSGYGFDSIFNEENVQARIKILKKHGYKLKKEILFMANKNQKKVFKLEALARLKENTFIEKIRMKNNTDYWVIFAVKGDLFLREEDIEYMFGYK